MNKDTAGAGMKRGSNNKWHIYLKVLFVEDDEDDYVFIRDLLAEIERVDVDLDWVSTYHDGMARITRGQYDVCLLDYRLGAEDGIRFIAETKSAQSTVPVIILTGQHDYGVDMEAMNTGAADYLIKDQISPELLERVIRYSISRGEATQVLRKAQSELEDRVKERTLELESAYDSLKKSSEKLKLFAYSIVHDLKSPAVSVYGLTRRLIENHQEQLSPKMKEYGAHIMQGAEQILSLVENINILIATEESPLKIERINPSGILEDVIQEFKKSIGARGITFRTPNTVPSIRADRLSLMRCLRNLIDNALKYGGEGLSTIEMDIQETEQCFIISISDDGIGMNASDTETIFDPFQRSISSKGTEGSGLGLAIMKEIAEKHKGEVWAQTGQEKGITFFMSISKDVEDSPL
jgi:signal transduction histidine kinase